MGIEDGSLLEDFGLRCQVERFAVEAPPPEADHGHCFGIPSWELSHKPNSKMGISECAWAARVVRVNLHPSHLNESVASRSTRSPPVKNVDS